MRIDDLLEMAARDLPEGWSVRIEVERGAAWVKAIAPDGVEYDINSDEAEIADLVRDAIKVATANAAEKTGKRMRTLKTWKPGDFSGVDCPHCGSPAEVLTACATGLVCEDDEARCCACGLRGIVNADETSAWVSWHDEPECSCEWCMAHPEEDCACGHCTPNRGLSNTESSATHKEQNEKQHEKPMFSDTELPGLSDSKPRSHEDDSQQGPIA